jgi:hypothetical protein
VFTTLHQTYSRQAVGAHPREEQSAGHVRSCGRLSHPLYLCATCCAARGNS